MGACGRVAPSARGRTALASPMLQAPRGDDGGGGGGVATHMRRGAGRCSAQGDEGRAARLVPPPAASVVGVRASAAPWRCVLASIGGGVRYSWRALRAPSYPRCARASAALRPPRHHKPAALQQRRLACLARMSNPWLQPGHTIPRARHKSSGEAWGAMAGGRDPELGAATADLAEPLLLNGSPECVGGGAALQAPIAGVEAHVVRPRACCSVDGLQPHANGTSSEGAAARDRRDAGCRGAGCSNVSARGAPAAACACRRFLPPQECAATRQCRPPTPHTVWRRVQRGGHGGGRGHARTAKGAQHERAAGGGGSCGSRRQPDLLELLLHRAPRAPAAQDQLRRAGARAPGRRGGARAAAGHHCARGGRHARLPNHAG